MSAPGSKVVDLYHKEDGEHHTHSFNTNVMSDSQSRREYIAYKQIITIQWNSYEKNKNLYGSISFQSSSFLISELSNHKLKFI